MTNVLNSAELEIGLHRQDTDESVWLVEHGLIESDVQGYDIEVLKDWYLPGSESYILDFQVNHSNRSSRFIAKACIKFFAKETVQEWMERRKALIAADVYVPALHSVHGADYIEEFIPFSFKEAYKSADDDLKDHLKCEFKGSFQKVFSAGFNPVSLHDVRSRGEDVVVIDYGSDLGPVSMARDSASSQLHKIETALNTIVH